MPIVRPCTDLIDNYNEISKICHETKEPVYITENGQNDIVILSNEVYEEYDKKMSECEYEMFYKEYPDFESFKKDLYEKNRNKKSRLDKSRFQKWNFSVLDINSVCFFAVFKNIFPFSEYFFKKSLDKRKKGVYNSPR